MLHYIILYYITLYSIILHYMRPPAEEADAEGEEARASPSGVAHAMFYSVLLY